MKKVMAILLSLALGAALISCKSDKDKTPAAQKEYEITLLYTQTDSLNPYAARTEQNRRLSTLLFDSLYKVGADYKPIPCLAVSYKQTGNSYSVYIGGATFSDGSALTAADIIYSYDFAKKSKTAGYISTLSEITSVSSSSPNEITFNLSHSDPYFLNLLTFPVIKADSAGKTDSDGVEIPPTGSGRYLPDLASSRLIRNEGYFDLLSVVKTINLIAAPDSESAAHYVQMGSTDLYYTDSVSNIVRMSGKRQEVDINHLVFIGINSSYGALQSKEMRYAISSAIDRENIVTSAYYGAATEANGFFNPAFEEVKSSSTIKKNADRDISIENLDKIGYNIKDESGYYTSAAGYKAEATLLVNSDNQSRVAAARLIASGAKAAGIEITVDAVDFDTYKRCIASGSFQLYLGEIEVGANMDLSGLVVPGGSAAYGVSERGSDNSAMTVSRAVSAYEAGEISISALSGVLITEMPQIPVCYRKGFLFYGDRIKSGVEGLSCDIYYSIASYKF